MNFMKSSLSKLILLIILALGPITATHADEIIPPPPEPESAPQETILIRNGNTVIFQGSVGLPAAGTVDITDNAGETHSINSQSVLGLLYAIDRESDAFSISDLQYYSSFGSLYLKCIIPASASALCDNWQYVVNDITPFSGMDATALSGGETIGLYFGYAHQVLLDKASIAPGESFTATAQKYNYLSNSWNALDGVTLGVTTPNPDDAWSPIVVHTQTVDTNGIASFALQNTGTYSVGISEDYYFPSYQVIVTEPTPAAPQNTGGEGTPPPPVFSVTNAINYLMDTQNPDGSFDNGEMYTDWAAIAFAADGIQDVIREKFIEFMKTKNEISFLLTDNERRVMALLALGENPYAFNGADYIAPIIKSFDGAQFGDINFTNDDIFALIPLASAGYTESDEMIAKDISFIISKQKENGSWEDSIDMTSATVQALAPFKSMADIPNSLLQAEKYLKNSQENNGGFGSVFSTSWAAQAMSALGASWVKGGNSIDNYFGIQQTNANDGAVIPTSEPLQSRIWATSYAIPAVLKKPWSKIMRPVQKQNGIDTLLQESEVENKSESEIKPAIEIAIVEKIEKAEKIIKKEPAPEKKKKVQPETPEKFPTKEKTSDVPAKSLSASAIESEMEMSLASAVEEFWNSFINVIRIIFH